MHKIKSPAGLCALSGLVLGLAFGRYRAASLLGAALWENWPLMLPGGILAVLAMGGREETWSPRPPAARILALISASFLFTGAILAFFSRSDGPLGLMEAIFPLLSGFGIILAVSDNGGQLAGLGCVIPVFYQGYLLLQLYRANATDTHRSLFAVELFCVIAVLLALYGAASVRFLPYSQLRCCLFGGLGLYAAGILLVPCVLAPAYVFSFAWITGPLLMAQAGLALHAAAAILWPPLREQDEDEDEEEDDEEDEEDDIFTDAEEEPYAASSQEDPPDEEKPE